MGSEMESLKQHSGVTKATASVRAKYAPKHHGKPGFQNILGNSVVAKLFASEPSTALSGGSHGRRRSKEPDEESAQQVMVVAADVLQNNRARQFPTLVGPAAEAIRILWVAASGREGSTQLRADARRARLRQACVLLMPYLQVLMGDQTQRLWLETQITPYFLALTQSIDRLEAEERVEAAEERVAAFAHGDTSYLDKLESADPGTKKLILHRKIKDLIASTILVNEQVLRLVHGAHGGHRAKLSPTYREQLEHVEQPPHMPGKASGIHLLENVQGVLWELDALLTLSDPELIKELQNHHGLLRPMASVTELVKAAVEIVSGVVTLTFTFSSIVARFNGQVEYAKLAGEWASRSVETFGDVIAGIEVAHGIVVLLSDASAEQKQEAVGEIVIGGSWLGLKGLGAFGVEEAGAMAGPVSTALAIAYMELKFMTQLYGEARVGITTGWLSLAFETMRESQQQIASSAAMLADAGLLAEIETDPHRQLDFRKVEQNWARTTGNEVDYFLERCEPKTYGPGAAYDPGAYPVLVEHFAPLMRFKGTKTPASAAEAARAVMQVISWTFEHSREVMAETSGFVLQSEDQDEASKE